MDIRKALEEVKKAQEEIQRLQKERETALKEVTKAKVEAKKNNPKDASKSPAYHSRSYWDNRYENEERAAKNSIYEWYVSFDQIKTLLKKHTKPTSKIYIPGCGNSVLGEDLATLNVQQIVGVDFSPIIIKSMQERAIARKLTNLVYKEGDLFNLKDETSSTYDLIIDKGTLDAIASDKANAQTNTLKNEMDNIGKYIHEMWRILKLSGKWIIITSMPIDIFESFISPYLQTWSTEKQQMISVSNWQENSSQNVRYQDILTSEAGHEVYYYTMEKLLPLKNEKDVLMESIHSLLDDATRAKLHHDMMDEEEELGLGLQRASTNTPSAVTTGAANVKLESNHVKYVEKVYTRKEMVEKEGNTYNNTSIRLQIDYSRSQLYPNGYLFVSYDIEGDYDDNDMIRLVCTASNSNGVGEEMDDSLCYQPSEQQCESFEYITITSTDGAVGGGGGVKRAVGNSKINFPCYAGNYYLSYIRDCHTTISSSSPPSSSSSASTDNTKPSYVKEYIKLSQSEIISLRFPCYPHHPDRLPNHNTTANMKRQRRRKVISMVPKEVHEYEIKVEDMQNVQRLSVVIRHKSETKKKYYTRCMAWIFPAEVEESTKSNNKNNNNTAQNRRKVAVMIEADMVTQQQQGQQKISTEYFPILLEDTFLHWQMIDWEQCYGEIQQVPQRGDSSGQDQQLFLRVSYMLPKVSPVPYASLWATVQAWEALRPATTITTTSNDKDSNDKPLRNVVFCCRYCEAELGGGQDIRRIHPLPTGFFDENMHDFICCENIGDNGNCGMNLTTDQMAIPSDALYYGPLYTILDIKHIHATACTFACKETLSMCDLLTTMGAAVAVSTLPGYQSLSNQYSGDKVKKSQLLMNAFLNPVIGVDSAAIRCKRCHAYLGDASLRADGDNGDSGNESANPTTGEFEFHREEVASVKLLWNKITIRNSNDANGTQSMQGNSSSSLALSIFDAIHLEQVISRLIVHIYEKFNIPVMCLYNAEALELYGQTAKTNREYVNNLHVIIIKVMNKNYRESSPATMIKNSYIPVVFHGVIKVGVQFGKALDILKGTEARIPLLHEEFMQLHERLSRKKTESLDGLVGLSL